ncbi:hypothetical protein I552_1559 [Mycobacterium xenopi 3993]|nr:hypothetical protein I552_1559 [Mycobacterium xenopi 3993]
MRRLLPLHQHRFPVVPVASPRRDAPPVSRWSTSAARTTPDRMRLARAG